MERAFLPNLKVWASCPKISENDGILRLFDPTKSEWLPTATERADNAEARIEQLLAEIDKLKSQSKR